ncbi:endonuclease/exonuclease/phosphatase family protein [Puniceicoccaceae bacterium K14]|nr:endonuclease/exonuclease/phosphatase family protein [Puniceicoccaceae bacterium K14]
MIRKDDNLTCNRSVIILQIREATYFMFRASKSMINLSLMTFNIAHGRGLSLYQGFHSSRGIKKNLMKIAEVIQTHQPDIIALQEVDESSHWNKHIDLLTFLKENTGYEFSSHGIHNTRDGRKPLAYGNAFLSKYPIVDSIVTPFGEKSLGEKGFMEVIVEVDGIKIDVINLHLDFRSRKTRIQQAERIIEKLERRKEIDRHHLPPIICGDFNTTSKATHDALHQMIKHTAIHGDYDYFPKEELTFPSHFPARGLDFVLSANPFRVQSSQAIRCHASDHLPVIANISLSYQDYETYTTHPSSDTKEANP